MRSARRRLAAGGAALGLALLIVGSGLDRIAEHNPASHRWVPGPFRANADRAAAVTALRNGERSLATDAAQRAIANDPADWRNPGLLALAQDARGQRVAAGRLVGLAQRFGWRDALSRGWLVQTAIKDGAAATAARNLDVLLRTTESYDSLAPLVDAVERTPSGTAALSGRLATRPGWAQRYLTGYAAPPGGLARRAAYLAESGMQPLGCAAIGPLVDAVFSQSRRQLAERVWLAHCPGAKPPGLVADSDFARLRMQDKSALFGWTRVFSGDTSVEVRGDLLLLTNRGIARRTVLTQPLALQPGSHGLSLRGGKGISVSLLCGTAPGPDVESGRFVVPPACSDQLLSVEVDGLSSEVPLEGVSISRD